LFVKQQQQNIAPFKSALKRNLMQQIDTLKSLDYHFRDNEARSEQALFSFVLSSGL